MQDKNDDVRWSVAGILGAVYLHIPEVDKKEAWDELVGLTLSRDYDVRWSAADILGTVYSYIPEVHKKEAWDNLIGLTLSEDDNVRWRAADTLGTVYSYIPELHKKEAWNVLYKLTSDTDSYVRASSYHSLGKASIFKAANAENDVDLKKEMETAIGFFEKSSQQSTWSSPAKFCLPFYRSFYILTFKKEETEAQIQEYIAEAKNAIGSSKSKEKLLEAVENLGNALKEAQKVRDFNEMKSDLNAYRRYCERACELLDTTEEKAPGASRLIRKGLPIIDERIKEILGEIHEKAKALYKQVKDTEYKEIGQQVDNVGQELSKVIDPIRLEKEVSRMLIPLTAMCSKIPDEDRGEACEILKQINVERNVEDKLPLINMFLSKVSTQMNKVTIMGNKQVQIRESRNSPPRYGKESVKKPPISIDEKIKEKNASIEQILDNWGFRLGHGKREEKKAEIEKWLHRFLLSEFDDAFLILERIQYHDSHTVDGYMEGLSGEMKKIFDNDLSEILFYPLGESPSSSGGNLLYSYRKDLGLPESSFPYVPLKDIDLTGKKAIIFFDDIIGSGNQAVKFAAKHLKNIKIDKYYVALMAFEKGIENVRNNGGFKKVIVHETISEELRAFSPGSQVFPDADTRERIKRLCEKYGKELYPKHPLGYDDSQALIVFPHNTPNNTLPIIWASEKNEKEPGYIWYPLWERIKKIEKKAD